MLKKYQLLARLESKHPDDHELSSTVLPWLNKEGMYQMLEVSETEYFIVGQVGYRGGVDMFDLLFVFQNSSDGKWFLSADCSDQPIREIFDAMQRRMS